MGTEIGTVFKVFLDNYIYIDNEEWELISIFHQRITRMTDIVPYKNNFQWVKIENHNDLPS